jgi:hypothetical protein
MASGALVDLDLYHVVIETSENGNHSDYYSWARVSGCTPNVESLFDIGGVWSNASTFSLAATLNHD